MRRIAMGPTAAFAALLGAAFGLAAAPGLTWLDAGELGAAARELGVAHPPGFPVFSQLHAAVMLLLPVGDAAFRGNLASGLLGALALALAYRAARALELRPAAAAGGLALTAAAPIFALHATTIEVYSGEAAFTAALCWAAARLGRDGDARVALAVGFGVGLSLGHHAELRLFAALLALPLVVRALRRRPKALGGVVGAGTFGAMTLLYLPLRAMQAPWRNWGDPSTPGALWDHFWGARIRAAFASRFGHFDAADLGRFTEQIVWASPLLTLLALPGFARLARRPGGFVVPLVFLIDAVYATTLNPMGLQDAQNGVPGLVALGLGAAASLDFAAEWLAARRPGGLPALPGAVAAAVALVGLALAPGRGGDRGLPALLDAIGDSQPPEALALVASDHFAAGLAFAQVVEGARPDLAVVVRQHVGYASSVDPVQRRLPAALAGWQAGAALADLRNLSGGWPVGWEWAEGLDAPTRPPTVGPRFPLFVPGAPDDGGFEAALTALLGRLPPEGLAEPQARRAFSGLLTDLGRFRLGRGAVAQALPAFEGALAIEPDSATRWTNLGAARSAAGRYAEAAEATREALRRAPGDRTARLNLARYLLHLGDAAGALAEVERLLAHTPDADALALRGVLRGNAGDLAGARADFEAAVALEPNQPEATMGLRRLQAMPGPR